MIRKKKLYKKPLKPFEAVRIKEENELARGYGLKNKREIWKTQAKVDYYRGRAKDLAKKPLEEQKILFNKLKALGLKVEGITDVLALTVEDLLERRLTTVLFKKKLANTPNQARQMVTHKKILIDGKVISSPGYLIHVAEENAIEVKTKKKKPKQEKSTEDETGDKKEELVPEESVKGEI